ncbi:MAG: hypothetical protein AMK71_04150 [Nitrospira bacterium SG8_35_4]|nr:MAG: hypothetical protein AMK71_04150 [Nitrospira bacterium SG8_35_4]
MPISPQDKGQIINPYSPQRKHIMAVRRKKVSDLYLQGYRKNEIAKECNVSEKTVGNDLKFLHDTWKKQQIDNIDEVKIRELAKLDELEKKCAEKFKACTKPTSGARFLEEWRKILERRSKLLGLDAAEKHIVAGAIATVSKEQNDAAFKAAQKASGMKIVKITPRKITHKTEEAVE